MNPALLGPLFAVAGVLISALAGFGLGIHLESQTGEATVAKLKWEYAHERQVALGKLLAVQAQERERLRAEAQAAQEAEARAVEVASAADAQIDTLKRSLAHAKQYRPAPAAPLQDRPRCVITWGDVGLLNAGAGVGGGAGIPPGANAGLAHAPASPDAALDSGLTQNELYEWHLDYAGRCRGLEAQLNGLIDLSLEREKQ